MSIDFTLLALALVVFFFPRRWLRTGKQVAFGFRFFTFVMVSLPTHRSSRLGPAGVSPT